MIFQQAKDVRERLERAEYLSVNIAEATALTEKKKELSAWLEKTQSLAKRRRLLENSGIDLSSVQEVERIRDRCNKILNRFTESPKSTTLVENQRWKRLSENLTEFNVSEETLQKERWKDFSSKLFGGVPPDQREQTIILDLEENRTAIREYRHLHQLLMQSRNSVPDTPERLKEVQDCAQQLSKIRFIENENVPETVKKFFQATSGGGADLELLTAEVIEWLSDNKMLSNYAVRAR